ncbi:triose-phosphate isomerase [Sphingorhabdus arenilitoris]|uniref:Triosephosphate isomerase n=1 Tax=Sphingorhabdus arenilitoris TaxID=1490041 RepID=A0ABV8RIW0_9SPHN
MRKLIVGNWKMNGTLAQLDEIGQIQAGAAAYDNVDSALCLPATLIHAAKQRFADFQFGGQDCHHAPKGAHTGCISAEMLTDAGSAMVILGHSERRSDQGESDADVRAKASAACAAGLHVILCVGETEAQRDAGQTETVILAQLMGSVPDDIAAEHIDIAYEPIWAIGTGRVPAIEEIASVHAAIRTHLTERFGQAGRAVRILYGGSMNGDNAAAILAVPNVGGGLIGGASLTAEKFLPIIKAASES